MVGQHAGPACGGGAGAVGGSGPTPDDLMRFLGSGHGLTPLLLQVCSPRLHGCPGPTSRQTWWDILILQGVLEFEGLLRRGLGCSDSAELYVL